MIKKQLHQISSVIFGVVVLCFFLSFFKVNYKGEKVITLTGIKLVSGVVVKLDRITFSNDRVQNRYIKVNSEPLAVVAFGSAVLGLFLGLINGKGVAIASAIDGIVGFIFLLLLSSKVASNMLVINYRFGFWLSMLIFLIAVGWNLYLIFSFYGSSGERLLTEEELLEMIKNKGRR